MKSSRWSMALLAGVILIAAGAGAVWFNTSTSTPKPGPQPATAAAASQEDFIRQTQARQEEESRKRGIEAEQKQEEIKRRMEAEHKEEALKRQMAAQQERLTTLPKGTEPPPPHAKAVAPEHDHKVVEETPPVKAVQRSPASEGSETAGTDTGAAQDGKNPDADPAAAQKAIDDYLGSLHSSAYAFNPPTSIGAKKSVTVYFQVDPKATEAQAAAVLQKIAPAGKMETGQLQVAPKMRATLSGEDFDVEASSDVEQAVSTIESTTWQWEVTPKHPGTKLPLNLNVEIVLPEGNRGTATLSKQINVNVTLLWLVTLIDWKWLLAGLGGVVAKLFHAWWKKRQAGKGTAEHGIPGWTSRRRRHGAANRNTEGPALPGDGG